MTIVQALLLFKATQNEDAFCEIYEYVYGGGCKVNVRSYARRYTLDELDVESMINQKILEVSTKYEDTQGDFTRLIRTAIKRGCIDLKRKQARREKYETEVMFEDEDGGINELYEIIEVAPTTNEDNIVEELKKHDQRQLIAYLISKADDSTLTSASAFIETDSYRKAAKQIGTSDKTVKSRIRRLAKRFDEKRFGSYYDYFTAPTIHVG